MISIKSIALGLLVLVGALAGFYGGFHSGRDSVARTANAAAPQGGGAVQAGAAAGAGVAGAGTGADSGAAGGGGGAGGFGGGRATIGTVTGLSPTGFVVHTANGADVKVVLGNTVTVRKTSDGTVADLQDSSNVTVTGQRNADGSLVAATITITPGTLRQGG